jgi:hypothetical protein
VTHHPSRSDSVSQPRVMPYLSPCSCLCLPFVIKPIKQINFFQGFRRTRRNSRFSVKVISRESLTENEKNKENNNNPFRQHHSYYEAGVYGGLVLSTKLRLAEFPRPFSIWLITYLIRLEAGCYSSGLVTCYADSRWPTSF